MSEQTKLWMVKLKVYGTWHETRFYDYESAKDFYNECKEMREVEEIELPING